MHSALSSGALAAAMFASRALAVMAGVDACIWHNTKPVKPYNVYWHWGGSSDKCMDSSSRGDVTVRITNSGLTCQGLGLQYTTIGFAGCSYKDEASWTLSYTTDSAYSGSTLVKWDLEQSKNRVTVTLADSSVGTSICGSKAHCVSQSTNFDSRIYGYFWTVFEPGKVGNQSETDFIDEGNAEMDL